MTDAVEFPPSHPQAFPASTPFPVLRLRPPATDSAQAPFLTHPIAPGAGRELTHAENGS
jgi:hypothetical protein